jgi:hypothetical protein
MKQNRPRLNLQAIADLAELADYTFAFAIRAIAAIGVADHLSDGPRHVEDLARRTQCDEHGLTRVLRALAAKSVFSEASPGVFALAPMGDLLRTDHPLSMRWFFRLEPDVQAMAGLEHTVRTGNPSFDVLFGKGYFDWLAAHDGPRARFRESQRALNRLELLTLTRCYPWQEVGSMVDVGGNDGAFLAALLRRYPSLRGMVFDLPEAAVEANGTFEQEGVSVRAGVVPGNLFEGGVPGGADVYTMKRVLVGFSDEQAVRALSNVRAAMGRHSRLLIIEPTWDNPGQVGVSLDLRMLVLGLGRVRTADEFSRLLAPAGMKAERPHSAGLLTIIPAGISNGEGEEIGRSTQEETVPVELAEG